MTFENNNTCINCPYAVYAGNVLFRSCSIANKGHNDSHMFIECTKRPELGFFEPSIRATDCPALKKQIEAI